MSMFELQLLHSLAYVKKDETYVYMHTTADLHNTRLFL